MKKYILIVCSLLSQTIFLGQEGSTKTEKLNALFEHCYENNLFNGSVLIVDKNNTLLEKTYGYGDIESQTKLNSDDSFLLASVSKQFTAMAVVLLHEEGKIQYDEFVSNYLQGFPYGNITVRHLLTHTSGLREYTSLVNSKIEMFEERFANTGQVFDNNGVLELFKNNPIPLDFEPGSEFSYSNTGYVYLALLVEEITGSGLSRFLDSKVFKPLGLKNTFLRGFGVADSNEKTNGPSPLDAFEKNVLSGEVQIKKVPEFFRTYGDGGIYSTAEDLLNWFNALDNEVLLSKQAQAEAYRAYSAGNDNFPYGFGWFVRNHPMNGHHILTHSGKFMGFVNSVFRDMDQGFVSIVLSNNSHSINGQINGAILKIIYDLPFEYPKIPAANVLIKEVVSEDFDSAKKLYLELKDDDRYDFSEKSINKMGYMLLRDKRTKEALDVFRWNTTLFPNSSNVYDSLAEAQLAMGQLEEARLNYKKSLELDSGNENAKLMLKKINQKG